MDEVPMSARIIGLADTFDAMTSVRPYREPLSVGGTLSELVRLAPQKYDPNALQALLIQIRRDAVGSNRTSLLDERIALNIAPADIDQLAASLQHKLTRGRVSLILPPSK
jgi:HD-GYP domain-containing protein (c-di-GMP phosphodiesterase class II)